MAAVPTLSVDDQSLWWPADRRVSPFRARPTGAPAPPPVACSPGTQPVEETCGNLTNPQISAASPLAGLAAVPQPLQRQELDDALQHRSPLDRLETRYPLRRERTHRTREGAESRQSDPNTVARDPDEFATSPPLKDLGGTFAGMVVDPTQGADERPLRPV
jgi:hypothetical protein